MARSVTIATIATIVTSQSVQMIDHYATSGIEDWLKSDCSKMLEADVAAVWTDSLYRKLPQSATADNAKSLIMQSSKSEHAFKAAW